MNKRLIPLALTAALLLSLGAVVTACGDDDGDGNGGALTLDEYFEKAAESKAESEARADEVQASADEELAAVESIDDAVEVFGNLIDDFVDATRQTLEDLDALEPPSEVEDLHNELVAIFQAGANALEGYAAELEEGIDLADFEAFGQDIETEFSALSTQSEVVCLQMQDIADENSIDVDLECGEDDEE